MTRHVARRRGLESQKRRYPGQHEIIDEAGGKLVAADGRIARGVGGAKGAAIESRKCDLVAGIRLGHVTKLKSVRRGLYSGAIAAAIGGGQARDSPVHHGLCSRAGTLVAGREG